MSCNNSNNTNDCCNTATFIGGYTPMDLRNASVYAQYKWYNKRCNDLGTGPNKVDVSWVPTYTTGQVSYNCPPGLNCQEGSCEITSESECMKWSFYPFDDTTTGASIDGTGSYLGFRKDDRFPQLNERCYLANTALRRWCVSPESRNPSDSKSNPFAYNKDDGKCYLTSDYCDQQGMDYDGPDTPQIGDFVPTKYNVPGGSNDVGGRCTQSGGMEFAEALFGNTITRGFKSGCLIPSDRKYKTNIKMLCKDYIAPGINLYYYNYNSELKKKHPKFAYLVQRYFFV